MSRTVRRHYKTKRKMRDGQSQRVATGCNNNKGCPWCEGNRTYSYKHRAPIEE